MNNFRKKPNTTRRPKHFMTSSSEAVKYDYMIRSKNLLLKTSSLLTENQEKTKTKKVSLNYQTVNLKPRMKNNPLVSSDNSAQLRMAKTSYHHTKANTNTNTITNSITNKNTNANQINSMIHYSNRPVYSSKYKQRRLSNIDSKPKITLKSTEVKCNTHTQTANELIFSAEKRELPNGRKTFISRSKSPLKSIKKQKEYINTNALFSSQQLMSHNIIQGCYKDIYNKRREHFLHNKYY